MVATDPLQKWPRNGAKPKAPNPPPYGEAAELVTERIWRCVVCGRGWCADLVPGDTFDPEAAARSCHTGIHRCSESVTFDVEEGMGEGRCNVPTVPHKTYCPEHSAQREEARWKKRKRGVYEHGLVYSDTEGEYFDSLDEAIEHAEEALMEDWKPDDGGFTKQDLLDELESMRLLLTEPVYARSFDPVNLVEDEAHDDYDYADLNVLNPLVEQINKALRDLGPLSYSPSDTAIDLKATLPKFFADMAKPLDMPHLTAACGCGAELWSNGDYRGWSLFAHFEGDPRPGGQCPVCRKVVVS